MAWKTIVLSYLKRLKHWWYSVEYWLLWNPLYFEVNWFHFKTSAEVDHRTFWSPHFQSFSNFTNKQNRWNFWIWFLKIVYPRLTLGKISEICQMGRWPPILDPFRQPLLGLPSRWDWIPFPLSKKRFLLSEWYCLLCHLIFYYYYVFPFLTGSNLLANSSKPASVDQIWKTLAASDKKRKGL